MLATRQSFRSVLFSCRRPLFTVPRPQLQLHRTLRSFTTISRAAQRLDTQTDEEYVRTVREEWGNNLPEGLLTESEFTVYQRYYGQPVRMLKEGESPLDELEVEEIDVAGTVTLMDKDGVEIEIHKEEEEEEEEGINEMDSVAVNVDNPREAKAYEQLKLDIERTFREEEQNEEHQNEECNEEEEGEGEDDIDFRDDGSHTIRTHPLTSVGRFATFPSTIGIPPSVQLPTLKSLSEVPNKHLDQAAYKTFGGPRLPDSPIFTGKGGKNLREVWLNVEDGRMSDISSGVFLATVMPGYYAQALSALTEVRRRLGSDWVLGHGKESGVKNILDVGSGGAGVLAWKSIMEAEYTRRRDEERERSGEPAAEDDSDPAAEATANLKASVVTASDSLRHRISGFLDNTTFLPRMPDRNPENLFHIPSHPRISPTPNPKQPRKLYDLIIATNNFLPLWENHMRKDRLRKLWSHLNPDGGILLLIEKGTPHGFEAIAGARATLLRSHISSPGSESRPLGGDTPPEIETETVEKEAGAIIAPCTNHEECPMFAKGYSQDSGRRDWCRFMQRYERPTYMQRIVGETKRNHEDLLYSYLAVRRGVDYRRGESEEDQIIDPQISEFKPPGFPGAPTESPYSMEQLRRYTFTLPRTILPPMKRHGHVILDVCTPAGKIERWTVPKSFGRIPFRDARKSRWGDLWALGAKTKVLRNIKIGGGKNVWKVDSPVGGRGSGKKVHWSRGSYRLGERVEKKKQARRDIRWAAQKKDMEAEETDSY